MSHAGAARRRGAVLVPGLAVFVLSLALFSPTLGHDFVNYDDTKYITENRMVRQGLGRPGFLWALTSMEEGNWHPLTWLSHMLDVQLFGLRAAGHHLTSVVIHAANALALYLVLSAMTAAVWPPFLTALLFAVHPLHVSSVAWAAERKDVLSAFFWILTMAAYLAWVRRPGYRRLVPVLLAFTAGLMSKPMLVGLPLVLLLLDYWPLGRANGPDGLSGLRLLREKAPLLVLAAASGVVTWIAQDRSGAVVSWETFTLPQRIMNALVSYVVYLWRTVWPVRLSVFYPAEEISFLRAAGAALVLLGITFIAVRCARRCPSLAAGWGWYLVSLLPVIGLVQVGDQASADRYTYIPLAGLFMGLAFIPIRRAPGSAPGGLRNLAVFLPLAVTLCAVTLWQLSFWRDSLTLFGRALAVTRGNHIAHNNLGLALLNRGDTLPAEEHFRRALAVNPRLNQALNNLGMILLDRGRADAAEEYFRRALGLQPGMTEALYNLGMLMTRRGKPAAAKEFFMRVLALKPWDVKARNNLGTLLAREGRSREALEHFRAAAAADPSYALARKNLGLVLFGLGRLDEARRELEAAVGLRPDDAEGLLALGQLLMEEGKEDEARVRLDAAARLGRSPAAGRQPPGPLPPESAPSPAFRR